MSQSLMNSTGLLASNLRYGNISPSTVVSLGQLCGRISDRSQIVTLIELWRILAKTLLFWDLAWFFQDYTEYYHIDEMFSYITDYMKLHGPYDGLLGFSQVQNGVVFIYLLPIESATIEICIATTFDLFHVISFIFRFQQSMTS